MVKSGGFIRLGGGALLALALAACQPVVRQRGGAGELVSANTLPLSALPEPKADTSLRAYFINVGNGMCHVVQCPGDSVAIVDDCGSRNNVGGLNEAQTTAFVRGLTKGRKVLVIATHKDADHSNYLPKIFDKPGAAGVMTVWAGGSYTKYSSAMQQWFIAANKGGAEVRVNNAPTAFKSKDFSDGWHNDAKPVAALACGAASTYVLTVDTNDNANGSSMVVMLEYGGEKVILPGDATDITEAQAIANFKGTASGAFLNATVLETSHHGAGSATSPTSNTTEWAEATVPYYLISSTGWHGSYGHPRCAALDRYATAKGKRLLTSSDGHTLWCGTDHSSWDERDDNPASYSTSSNGMLVVDITAPGSKSPRTTLYYETKKSGGPP